MHSCIEVFTDILNRNSKIRRRYPEKNEDDEFGGFAHRDILDEILPGLETNYLLNEIEMELYARCQPFECI